MELFGTIQINKLILHSLSHQKTKLDTLRMSICSRAGDRRNILVEIVCCSHRHINQKLVINVKCNIFFYLTWDTHSSTRWFLAHTDELKLLLPLQTHYHVQKWFILLCEVYLYNHNFAPSFTISFISSLEFSVTAAIY